MAVDAGVVVNIAAQWTGNKAFKQADTATDKLNRGVKNLGKSLGLALSVGAILAFGKAAVKAAAEDEKAQKQLALALKNVGLGRDVAASEAFIQKLQTEFGIVDDELRPAYQDLAIATKNTAESQRLMGIALDVAAANSLDVGTVTKALSKAYLGNNTALGKLGVGISKADLKAGNFNDIMEKLAKTFKGAASEGANTFSGKMSRLTVSIENAKEILGKGLIDSFMILTDSQGIEELQVKIENFATSASENMKKLAGVFKENETLIKSILAILTATYVATKILTGMAAALTAIKTLNDAYKLLRATALMTAVAEMFALNPYGAAAMVAEMVALIGLTILAVDALGDAYERSQRKRDFALDPKKYDNAATAFDKQFKGQEKLVKIAKVLTAEEIKTLNAKKLQLAIDKAKLALGKGEDVFDINKIQLAAAELNQAQLLGKVTNQSQLLQITNDLARLNVKQSILDLEAAIAAKDIKAIEAGTAKLNGDLKILGALTNQELKLRDIESILKDIVPKDLINLANLDAALAKLRLLGSGIITPMGTPTPTGTSTPTLLESLAAGSFAPVVGGGYSSTAGNYASSGFPGSDRGYGSSGGNTIVVNTGIGDPNAIAEAIDQVLRDATDRGTLRVAS